ncbi:hypothetical protein [Flavobacterium sp.]|uniref:hypothetical protein n=1 Tax=Flavobacterium sp. TaxID=239 RepID=UPI0026201630|nr:hypothetical protein [Flavobacterium sp.]
MKNVHIIFLVLLGFLLTPTSAFACGKNSKHSCKKEASAKTEKDDCCENGKHSGNNHDGCGGKCGHSSCGCATSCAAGITFLKETIFQKDFLNSYAEKQKFYSHETTISSGFYSLWLIPKIS